jgi:CRP/FNR family transcriptional regulator, polysaccharide utilization system transcription regulator
LYLSLDEFLEEDVFQYLIRQDIAGFASVTVESAVKFLKEFEKEKLVKFNGKDIIINRDKLEEFGRVG